MPKLINYYNYKVVDRETNKVSFYKKLPDIANEYNTNRQTIAKIIKNENMNSFKNLFIEKVKIPAFQAVEINMNYTLQQ